MRTALLTVIQSFELRRPPGVATHGLRTGGRRPWRRGVVRNTVSISAPTSTPAPRRNVTTQVVDPERRYSIYTPELNLLAETALTTNATPPVEWEYVWFGGQPVAQIETATNTIAWYFNDHLGTPIVQTDASANVIWRVEREPFGKTFEVRAGAARHQPLAFPGQEEQGGETSYNVFRWYRSGWGRYTQGDPIGLEGGVHLYAYANTNPLVFSDPGGLSALTLVRPLIEVLVDTAIVAGIVVGGAVLGLSQADVDAKIESRTRKKCQCPEDRLKQLQEEKNRQCNKKRSCNGQMDLGSLQVMRAQSERCAFARHQVMVECFDGGDNPGDLDHQGLLREVIDNTRECDGLIDRLMKRNFRKGRPIL